jgi:hypothetical protein
MSDPKQPLKLDLADLNSPRVEAYIEEQRVLRQAMPEEAPQPLWRRVVFASWFYLAVAGAVGACAGWALLEPFFAEMEAGGGDDGPAGLLVGLGLFPTVTGAAGLFVGAAEGLMCRNLSRAALSAAVGLGVAFAVTLILVIPVGIVFLIFQSIAVSFGQADINTGRIWGMTLVIIMIGRALAWAIAAAPAGLGQGLALGEKKMILNGLLGAVLGGLLGGLMFDPIEQIFRGEVATLSRGVGFSFIGLSVGLFVGLVENWTKTAWLLMRAGPLAGKQFVMYRNPTVLGSSPKADIYLFKDPDIEPRHALIHNRGGIYEIEHVAAARPKGGTQVNGESVMRRVLQPGDRITLGRTVLEFAVRDAR